MKQEGQPQQIGNINLIEIENLFFRNSSEDCKLSYNGYCAIVQDYGTY